QRLKPAALAGSRKKTSSVFGVCLNVEFPPAFRRLNTLDHRKSVGLLLLAALFWSTGGVLLKFVEWPPLAVAGGRGLIAGLFLMATCGRSLRFTFSPVQLVAAVAIAGAAITF